MIYYLLAILCVIIDQISKFIVIKNLKPIGSIPIIQDVFHLTYCENTGAAFSLLENKTIFFIIIGILVIFYIFKYLIKEEITSLEKISYILLTGGIVGNLIDRIIYGYVVDYLRFIIFGYNFPIFNLADICITLGVILLIINIFRKE